MSGPEQDQELEDFLARRSPVYQRLSERDHAEPPPELDRLVAATAREAIDKQTRVPIFRSSRWALPVALAATVVLSLAVVLNLGRNVLTHNDAAAPVTAMKSEQAMEPRDTTRPRESAPVVTADMAVASSTPAAAPSPSSEAPVPVLEAESAGANSATRRIANDALVAANPAALRRQSIPANAERDDAIRGAVPTQDDAASVNATAAGNADDQTSSGRIRDEPQPPVLSASTRGTAPPVAPSAESAPTARDGSAPALTDEARRANPQAWLREIEQLRAAGKAAEAAREMAAFREAFPEHPRSAVATPPVK